MKHLSRTDYVLFNTETQEPLYFSNGDIILYADKAEAQEDVSRIDEVIIPCTDLPQQFIGKLIDQINK